MKNDIAINKQFNATIDIIKLLLAFLVVAIHTEPFGFSFYLDKSFGILTRICVPFFFVASSYFFFSKDKNPLSYVKHIFILYALWSIIYLPFDIPTLTMMSPVSILVQFLWEGNKHALWYLCGSIIGFSITYILSRKFKPKTVLIIGIVFLLIGCIKSTYAIIFEDLFSITIPDFLGS